MAIVPPRHRAAPSAGGPEPLLRRRRADWIAWLLGTAVFAAVLAAALHFSEMAGFLRIVERAEPVWLLAALLLQASTYVFEGGIWRVVARAVGFELSAATSIRLSLVKLFVDQSIPSAGLSGTLVVGRALSRLGLAHRHIVTGVVVRLVSYYAAYVVALVVAIFIAIVTGRANAFIIGCASAFCAFAVAACGALLAIVGRRPSPVLRRLARRTRLRRGLASIASADPSLARNPLLLLKGGSLQLSIVLLDTATLYVLIEALGITLPPGNVFMSFMLSTLFRSLGVLPGGLGSFEAMSVWSLKLLGMPVADALAATLMFRALSFWLPMLPGFWLSRSTLMGRRAPPPTAPAAYWARDAAALLREVDSTPDGLSSVEAARRLALHGPNELAARRSSSRLDALVNQLRNPLLLVLCGAAVIAALVGEPIDAGIVFVIVVATVAIGYAREYDAESAAAALRAHVITRATVLRGGQRSAVPVAELVPGDVVLLSAGSIVPGDGVVLEATDCYVGEAVLTGESFPVHKQAGTSTLDSTLATRRNCVFFGTNVRSGMARVLLVCTGAATELGRIAHRLESRAPPTEFDRGLLRFGYLLTKTMLIVVLLVFAVHMMQGRDALETLLFAVALAVGLSPELLPAVLRVNLARGAALMAERGVLVRRLNAIENLGSMDILCTDKTGTLTEGVVRLEGAYDAAGVDSPVVLALGAVNATLESGLDNPLDDAIVDAHRLAADSLHKLGEIPFDFTRKRVSVIVEDGEAARLIAKGAFAQVLEVCTALPDGAPLDEAARERLTARYRAWGEQGTRVLAVATRRLPRRATYDRRDEQDLCFEGFLTFLDRPKTGVDEAIAALRALGITIKIISGDAAPVARHVATAIGLPDVTLLTGRDIQGLDDDALWHAAERAAIFAEVDPNQKERIIRALARRGHVVGFLGDGVNDAPAMHAADLSLSVMEAVDVAREAADFVLLERSLEVIRQGVLEGRRTFANTLKYILTTTSANLGNMMSMALASLFLPFLPLLAGQILLNNFLSDIPALGIADDNVDAEMLEQPRRWDISFITRYMVEFGGLSSVFDGLTFWVLLAAFHAPPALFRTGWFVESLLTELLVALVVRTRRPCYRSRPGRLLLISTAIVAGLAFAIPYLPGARLLEFVPLTPGLVAALLGVTLLYVLAAELMKRWFYARQGVGA